MKKLAIFVEGYTELLFLDKLITEILGDKNVVIEKKAIQGGAKSPKSYLEINAATENHDKKFHILIYDCNGDKLVAQRIREEHPNLTTNGYSLIIGVRDVRPDFEFKDIPQLEVGLKKYIKTKLIPVEFILSVMEIESWFLSEYNHFSKISQNITVDSISKNLGFNPRDDDMQTRLEPAKDIINCYGLDGKTYIKGTPETPDNLDYTFIYTELHNKIPQLNKLINLIDSFAE